MNKYLVLGLMILGLTSCNQKDEQYYRNNIKELQQAIKACPNQQPEGATCAQLGELNSRLTSLAYQLQYSPQGFGNKILAIQQTIADQRSKLKTDGSNEELKKALKQNELDLVDYLAVVKWLESPES
ncbi:hypothetical protein [Legionella shakespearei]|uniref:Secreted endonuclease n=1 Tax=Legionella shakespearei DSM 23087 TaxID=1122169 RepID=A0A0W0YQW7_9GAMM|nr:hypothetical protein [Legionella shakespearei]KTD59261.1 secreted endonuclease [Legionella shakespearei DSM 23087]